jgi:hypothetical protein
MHSVEYGYRHLPLEVSGLYVNMNRQHNHDLRYSDLYNVPLIRLEQFRK